jgi:hypothetical protein
MRLLAPVAILLGAIAGCGTGPAETGALGRECVVPDAALASVRSPIDLAMARAGEALIYQTQANRYALLDMPGCRVTPLADVPERIGLGDAFVVPGGTRIFCTSPPGRADLAWWFAHGADAPTRLAFLPDPGSASSPVLSNDGQWVAWLRPVKTQDAFHFELAMRHPDGTNPGIVSLAALEPDTYELLELDAATREITLARHLNEFIRVGFDGAVRGRSGTGDLAAQPGTYVRLPDGYFAWDAVRESGAYRIGWVLPAGAGTLAIERLRMISHAVIDPTGRFAAVSLETQHGRLLSLSDAVAVIRLSDRQEVFRAYLPRFTRTDVTLLAGGYFAYAHANNLYVLRLPK